MSERAAAGPRCGRRQVLAAAAAMLAAWPAGVGATDLVPLIAAARPSVLPLGTYSATASPRFSFRGTAFAVGDGTRLITNAHVLPSGLEAVGAPPLAVLLPGAGRERMEVRLARVLETDADHDLALLAIDGAALPALKLAAAGSGREGQAVALIGYPVGGVLGFQPVTHRGIIASIAAIALPAPSSRQLDARAVSRLRAGNFDIFQLDATAYPGNSGGPLFDAASGEVLAVINMVLVKGSRESALSSPTGITYAIPVRHVHELLQRTAPR